MVIVLFGGGHLDRLDYISKIMPLTAFRAKTTILT